jgi:hypothetical protein
MPWTSDTADMNRRNALSRGMYVWSRDAGSIALAVTAAVGYVSLQRGLQFSLHCEPAVLMPSPPA